ncbi:CAP domain-containing protein [Pseudonocardia sp. CA-107938]|uniref:CAP domain-containing protein n=1 Tax=Pseudonocardia sp. CA-107938 TaxID=3240021 RepID=UPI003D8FC60B
MSFNLTLDKNVDAPYSAMATAGAAQDAFNHARKSESPTWSGATDLTLPDDRVWQATSPEEQALLLVNKERADRGLPALEWDRGLLSRQAANHCREMVQFDYYEHASPLRFENDAQWECLALGPTVAYGVYSWMYQDAASKWNHRKYVLGERAAKVGIGTAVRPDGLIFLAFYLVPASYASDPTVVTAPPALDVPTVVRSGKVQVTNVLPAQSGAAAAIAAVVFHAGAAVAPPKPGDRWHMKPTFLTVAATNEPPGGTTWTAQLDGATAATLHAVAVDRSGNWTDRAAATSAGTEDPPIRLGTGFTSTDWGTTLGSAVGLTTTWDSEGGAWWVDPDGKHGFDFEKRIVGDHGACVYGFALRRVKGGIYRYAVVVDGRGPKGFGSGWFTLWFTDETGDTYKLGLWDSSRKSHQVEFNSDKPSIVKVSWG